MKYLLDLLKKHRSIRQFILLHRREFLISGAIFLILLTGILSFFHQNNPSPAENSPPEIPAIHTPEPGDTSVPADVVLPKVSTPALQGATTNIRTFSLEIEKNSIHPSTIVVNKWDIVHFDIHARDEAYVFAIPDFHMSQSVPVGTTKTLEFQAMRDGRFEYTLAASSEKAVKSGGFILVNIP